MYKLEFTLKQHTPIIHFQHDQDGATLRASEVKPKLDRFIIEKLGGIEMIKRDNPEWLVGKHDALDYKLNITASNELTYYLPYPTSLNSQNYPNKERNFRKFLSQHIDFSFEYLSPSPYFANADKIKFNDRSEIVNLQDSKPNEIIFALLRVSDIGASIITPNESLINEIKNTIDVFFLKNNFGTRQNKGFGSFSLKSVNGHSHSISQTVLKSVFEKKSARSMRNQNEIFKFILEEYNLLKSGQNRPYKKSELFKYFINKNIRWEKRWLKQILNSRSVQLKQKDRFNYEPIDYDNSRKLFYNDFADTQQNNYMFIRGLLGLAENFEFATYNRGRLKIKVNHLPSVSHREKIERFKSPLFFKVIDGNVYLSLNNSYSNMEGATFEFYDGRSSLGRLEIPRGFNLRSFITSNISTNWSNI